MQMTCMWAQLLGGGLARVSCQHGHGDVPRTRSGPSWLLPLEPVPSRWCCWGCPAKTIQLSPFLPASLWLHIATPELLHWHCGSPPHAHSGLPSPGAELSCLGQACFMPGQHKAHGAGVKGCSYSCTAKQCNEKRKKTTETTFK